MNIHNLDKIPVPEELEKRLDKVYNRKPKRRLAYMAAACMILFASGFAFPAYTQNLPVYSQLFSLFAKEKYQEYSDKVLLEQESNGIKVTMSEIIYTGNVLSFSYIVESEKDLGNNISMIWDEHLVGGSQIQGASGSANLDFKEKKEKYIYVGYQENALRFNEGEEPDSLHLKLKADRISSHDIEKQESVEHRGNWTFDIEVKKLDYLKLRPDDVFEQDGLLAKIESITLDKVNAKFDIKLWNTIGAETNVYEIQNAILSNAEGQQFKVEIGGAHGNADAMNFDIETQDILPKGEYTLEIEFVKTEYVGYNEKGEKERVSSYGTKEYEQAPSEVHAKLSFDINNNMK
ncbi:MAG: DUF4179 domain-containing protein [Peptostreptococcaceae bacterium]|nr:DUF4179 domain-containing protein [Peptostreptococcaceae bacterium]